MPCFADCGYLALDRLCKIYSVGITGSSSRPSDVVHQLVLEMDHISLHLDHISQVSCTSDDVIDEYVHVFAYPNNQEQSSVSQALASLLQLLMTYCRSELATLTGMIHEVVCIF